MSGDQVSDATNAGETRFMIGRRAIAPEAPSYLIAEVGSNHDGDLERALEHIREAAKSGADAVKFQSFRASMLSSLGAPGHEALRALEIPEAWYPTLYECAGESGIDFLSTPFDELRVNALGLLGVPAIKIASGDLTHLPLMRCAAESGLPVLVSTGLAFLDEVRDAVRLLRESASGGFALLHCVASYPPSYDELNLRAIETLAAEFSCPVGFSDHSPGSAAPLGAVALGARIIEKHVTFDRSAPGPDHAYAMTYAEFKGMCGAIRALEAALGDGIKRPAESEQAGRIAGRRGIFAAVDLPAGARIEPGMLKIVRPAKGLAPSEIGQLIGRCVRNEIRADEPLLWRDLD